MATPVPRPSSKLSRSVSASLNPPNSASSSSKSLPPSYSSSLSSHLAMVELKSRALAALSKLSDRDTHQIAVEELEKIIRTLPATGVPMLLHALIHDPAVSSPGPQNLPASKQSSFLVARRESLRLLALLCACHTDAASAHLPRIIAHIVRRLRDPTPDSFVREACRDAAGSLATLYLRPSIAAAAAAEDGPGGGGSSPVVGLFVKPFFEAMAEQNKVVQGGAAMCLAKVVECGGIGEDGKIAAAGSMFQRLCPRIFKTLGSQSFLAKGALLSVVSSLAQVGAINPQSIQQILQIICECLENSDWATRKAAADTLCVLASCLSHLLGDGAAATIATLEACRFDKVKPCRDSIMEALQLWKKIKGEDGISPKKKESRKLELVDNEEKRDQDGFDRGKVQESLKISYAASSSSENEPVLKGNSTNMPEKAAALLRKKAPTLTDKELNPEFFQKLENRSLDDLPVEVMVPHKRLQSSHSQIEGQQETCRHLVGTPNSDGTIPAQLDNSHGYKNSNAWDKRPEQRLFWAKDSKAKLVDVDDRSEGSMKDLPLGQSEVTRLDAHTEGTFISNKASWSAIQRQLAQLERQQTSIMNMLQDFMGGSHDNMVNLENRVRGLERVVEEMAHDLAMSSGRRGGSMFLQFDNSPARSSYTSSKFSRLGEMRLPFSERYFSSGSVVSGVKGRDSPRRSESETCDSSGYTISRNGFFNSKGFGTVPVDGGVPRANHDTDRVSGRRAWNKGSGSARLGEGPSARSVWRSSKDEATLEAIRVAGEDNGTSRNSACIPVPQLDAEALTDDNRGADRGPLWASWTRAMDLLHIGDIDSAYAGILSTSDDLLLVKLMDKSGPVFDQLSGEIVNQVLHAVGQFVLEQSLFDIALSWLQQLSDLVENDANFLRIPLELKREILLNLHEACTLELPENWEGALPDQLMMHLGSAWGLNLQQLIK
ncbi:microtubule-associated protein TORTIFOLIA1-like [Zingiber officinale]|uniref:microtubule-associated protein TORTIFOLIA1-like n=1 Tax=Zingiber officinale TaxID=94328 RepID=UPI001C4D5C96|nr:microtubule-associated protein TORTIFOLIA1-like [Zingiber officinale]